MIWLQLTGERNQTVFIRSDQVVAMEIDGSFTKITLTGGNANRGTRIPVTEKPREILTMMEKFS